MEYSVWLPKKARNLRLVGRRNGDIATRSVFPWLRADNLRNCIALVFLAIYRHVAGAFADVWKCIVRFYRSRKTESNAAHFGTRNGEEYAYVRLHTHKQLLTHSELNGFQVLHFRFPSNLLINFWCLWCHISNVTRLAGRPTNRSSIPFRDKRW